MTSSPFHRISPPVAGDESEQSAQQGGLPGADGPGDDGERATFEHEVDVGDAASALVTDGEAGHVEAIEPLAVRPVGGVADPDRCERARPAPQRGGRSRDNPVVGAIGQQPGHPLDGHLGLAVVGAQAGRPAGKGGKDGDGAGEQPDVADGGRPIGQRGDDQEHDEPGAEVADRT